LLQVARDAFAQALQTTAVVCTAVATITAIAALIFLRRIRPGAAAHADAGAQAPLTSAAGS
jgi:hypothetical protein